MRTSNILDTPTDRDWSEGYAETWDTVLPDFDQWTFDEVRAWLDDQGYENPDYLTDDNYADEASDFVYTVMDMFHPVMNYSYPVELGAQTPGAAQSKLLDLPVVVVEIANGYEHVLALTGGGMDLSWEICEAYIALGSNPPVHFCDLPVMAGRGESDGDKAIIRACADSSRLAGSWVTAAGERLKERYPAAFERGDDE